MFKDAAAETVDQSLDGFNGTIFAYGNIMYYVYSVGKTLTNQL